MKNRKFFEDRITRISTLMSDAQRRIQASNQSAADEKQLTMKEYVDKYRTPLNTLLIELCMGAEFCKNKKGSINLKFKHRLMSLDENATLSATLDRYINTVEIPAINAWLAAAPDADDDMAVPETMSAPAAIQVIDKPNKKKLMGAILGENGAAGYTRMYLMVADLAILIANADKIRKRQKRNMAMIVGGVLILVTAAAVVAVMVHKRNKKSVEEELAEALDERVDELAESLDERVDDMAASLDDSPHVTLD